MLGFAWGWGAGTDGQLGTGVAEDFHSPQPLPLSTVESGSTYPPPPSSATSHIACGGAHAIALTGDGKILTWGRNSHGQLGHGHKENWLLPKLVKSLECFTVTYVSAGWNHSAFITETGCLFTFGDGSYGQLGHGDNLSRSSPVPVSFFNSRHVMQIKCGMRHSLAVAKDRKGISVYSFGSGRHGQLGITLSSSSRLFNFPQLIPELDGESIGSIDASRDRSAAISSNGDLYIWGRAFQGKLGNCFPHKIQTCLKFSQVALGWNHALLLTDDGEIFMLGGRFHGRLSDHSQLEAAKATIPSSDVNKDLFPEQPTIPSLERVPGLDGKKISGIAAGAEHSSLVTEKGEIMTWGWGEHGQLGLGNTLDQIQPQLVTVGDASDASSQFKVFCGSGFTFALKKQLCL